MTDLVPSDEIEQIVGARRHALAHLGRAVSAEQVVYVLHSRECLDSGIDLRDCIYSRALGDHGIDAEGPFAFPQDQTVTLQVETGGWLMPDDDAPSDVEYLSVWDYSVAPGGMVCSACGMPTESEPCSEHQSGDVRTPPEGSPR